MFVPRLPVGRAAAAGGGGRAAASPPAEVVDSSSSEEEDFEVDDFSEEVEGGGSAGGGGGGAAWERGFSAGGGAADAEPGAPGGAPGVRAAQQFNRRLLRAIRRLYGPADGGTLFPAAGAGGAAEASEGPFYGLTAVAGALNVPLRAHERKAAVMVIGNISAGKSTFINWFAQAELQRTGMAVETAGLTIVTGGRRLSELLGDSVLSVRPWLRPLVDRHPGLRENLTLKSCPSPEPRIQGIDIYDTPGLADGDHSYFFDVVAVVEDLAPLVDLFLVFFDPVGQAMGRRLMGVVHRLSVLCPEKLRFCLSKIDDVRTEEERIKVVCQIAQTTGAKIHCKHGFDLVPIYIPGAKEGTYLDRGGGFGEGNLGGGNSRGGAAAAPVSGTGGGRNAFAFPLPAPSPRSTVSASVSAGGGGGEFSRRLRTPALALNRLNDVVADITRVAGSHVQNALFTAGKNIELLTDAVDAEIARRRALDASKSAHAGRRHRALLALCALVLVAAAVLFPLTVALKRYRAGTGGPLEFLLPSVFHYQRRVARWLYSVHPALHTDANKLLALLKRCHSHYPSLLPGAWAVWAFFALLSLARAGVRPWAAAAAAGGKSGVPPARLAEMREFLRRAAERCAHLQRRYLELPTVDDGGGADAVARSRTQ